MKKIVLLLAMVLLVGVHPAFCINLDDNPSDGYLDVEDGGLGAVVTGVVKGTGTAYTASAYLDIVGLWDGGACSGYLKSDGTCDETAVGGYSTDVQTMLGSADNSSIRTNLGLAIGTDVQAYDADLSTAASGSEANNSTYFGRNSSGTVGWHDDGGLGGGAGITDGTAVGQLPVWDGDSWEPESSLTSMSISGGTANMAAYWDGDQKLASSSLRPGQITTGATTTPDANTNVGIDTTSDQLKYYGGAVRVLSYKKQKSFVVKSPADTDDFLLFKSQQAITITDIHCIVDPADSGESISVDIQECDSTGDNCSTVDAAITADNDGAEDDGSLSNGAIDAGDWVKVVLGSPTGTISFLTCSIYYVITAD